MRHISKNGVGHMLYRLGYFVEYESRVLRRKLREAFGEVAIVYALLVEKAIHLIRDVGTEVQKETKHAADNLQKRRKVITEQRSAKDGSGTITIRRYIDEPNAAKKQTMARQLTLWALPVLSGILFLGTIFYVLNAHFALAVESKGQRVGVVAKDTVYLTAAKMVEGRIVYTDETQEGTWDLKPKFSLQMSPAEKTSTEAQLADAILKSSGEQIKEATGFYVDGKFYGATVEPDKLQQDLDAAMAPYKKDDPSFTVAFANDVKVVPGVFLADTVVEYGDIQKLFGSQVQGERTYAVVAGDSPSVIASKNGITMNELYALNPKLKTDTKLYPGTPLLISRSKPFLQVKQVQRVVEREELNFKTKESVDSTMAWGTRKTVVKGQKGINNVTYEITYLDGAVASKVKIATEVVQPIIDEEIKKGNKLPNGSTVAPGSGGMVWPAGSRSVSRGFTGAYPWGHSGIDIYGPYGTPLYAAQSGVVTGVYYTYSGYGIHLIIDHGGGISTLYGHTSGIFVHVGQAVNKGQVVAQMGSTGWSTGNHLHFEVRIGGVTVNPAPYIY